MLTAPPFDIAPVRVNAPAAISAAAPAGSTNGLPLSKTVGPPTTLGVSVSPLSRSVTEKLPAIGARFCAEASSSSSTAGGLVVSLSSGPSLVPVTVKVTSWVVEVDSPSDTCTV